MLALGSLPIWRALCLRTGLVDDPGHRKIHGTPMPLAGGLAVFGAITLVLAAGWGMSLFGGGGSGDGRSLRYGLSRRGVELGVLWLGSGGMLCLGWLDDRHELKALPKFLGQFVVALLVAFSGVRITLFVHNELFSYAVTVLWILTLVNALNFMDNMNGLCAGVGAASAIGFAANAAASGQYLNASLALTVAGALAGFLPHNFPNARSFLGDSGSHLVGYWLAVLAILPHFYREGGGSQWAVLRPLLVLAVPLTDMAWVVGLRTLAGKPFWIGDTNHLSHRLVRAGMTRAGAVLLIWLFCLLCTAASLL